VDQYVELQRARVEAAPAPPQPKSAAPAGAVLRATRKEIQRLERDLDRLGDRERALHDEMASSASDHARLHDLQGRLEAHVAERERLEAAWLERSESLEGG
jgi:ATP-binding cassette subfamily F protein uup